MQPRRIFVFVPIVLALFTVLPAFGKTITVTNSDASGQGSLPYAISMAVSGDTINFTLTYPATITLTGTLTPNTSLNIVGPGASKLAISGGDNVPVVQVNSGITVQISGVTIEKGHGFFGGGIINYGTLTLTDSTVSNNSSYLAGGIFNSDKGTLTLTGSTVSNNSAFVFGGGIGNKNGILTLTDSTVSNNSIIYNLGLGGGVYNIYGTVTLTRSTVSENSSPYGGGIFNNDHATLTLTQSTVSGNSASAGGGGIYNNGYGKATVTNSTITDNSSGNRGGGIFNDTSSQLTLSNTTVSGNSATYSGSGGGIFNNATMTLKNTVVANSNGGNCLLSGVGTTSDGYNLSDDLTCSSFLNAVTDRNDISAGLDSGGLQDNGGPTKTVALLSTSEAVDAIPEADCTLAEPDKTTEATTLAADQRGITRPQGSACDIGAFELVETVPFSLFSAKLDIQGDSSFDLNSTFTLGMGSDGINPLKENVKLQVGPYETTIPAGSFHPLKNGKKKGSYVFSGVISGASISVQIVPLGMNAYQFKATCSPVDLSGVANPVTVTLTIDKDTGSTSVYADSN